MVAETRSPGVSTRARKRVKQQAEAAALLGVSPQRLQEMRRLAPWWKPELCDDLGWDVVGIAIAQCQFHEKDPDDGGTRKRLDAAELMRAEEEALIRQIDRQKRQRVEQESSGQLVRVEVVQSLLSEALGELRRLIDDVPWVMSQQVPPEVTQYVWVNDTLITEVAKLAPLQRVLLKVTESYQRWLDRVPEEVFEVDAEEAKKA